MCPSPEFESMSLLYRGNRPIARRSFFTESGTKVFMFDLNVYLMKHNYILSNERWIHAFAKIFARSESKLFQTELELGVGILQKQKTKNNIYKSSRFD